MGVWQRLRTARVAWHTRPCETVGDSPVLHGTPTIYGSPGRILIGDRFRLSSIPVASHLSAGPDGVLTIGDDVSIAHGAAITAMDRVYIGDGTCIGPFVLIMDTNFHGGTGDQSLQHDTRPVTIGRNCRIGTAVTIARGAVIGDGAEILAGSVVSSAIPDGACAGGARARVRGRAGDPGCRWDGARALLPELVQQALNLEAAPALETDPATLNHWDSAHIQALVAAIERRFGTMIDVSIAGRIARLGDLAAAIEQARHTRPR
jgi:acetyltransferase-like isoleucine patch superfamily enzyme/acyl carrier protein